MRSSTERKGWVRRRDLYRFAVDKLHEANRQTLQAQADHHKTVGQMKQGLELMKLIAAERDRLRALLEKALKDSADQLREIEKLQDLLSQCVVKVAPAVSERVQ